MITGIDVVYLHVIDHIKMANWYRDVLGLKIGFRTDDKHWQEFQFQKERSPTRFALDAVDKRPSKIEKQRAMISFSVEDINQFVESMKSKNTEFYGEPKIVDTGRTLFATARDPEGNWIQFSQRK